MELKPGSHYYFQFWNPTGPQIRWWMQSFAIKPCCYFQKFWLCFSGLNALYQHLLIMHWQSSLGPMLAWMISKEDQRNQNEECQYFMSFFIRNINFDGFLIFHLPVCECEQNYLILACKCGSFYKLKQQRNKVPVIYGL